MLTLHWPWLLLLLPLPWLARRLLPAVERQDAALFFPQLDAVLAAQGGATLNTLPHSHHGSRWQTAILWLMWMLLLIAAARPQWIGEPDGIPTSGRDLLIAVDLSGSMETHDMIINGNAVQRIDAVKQVVGDFVQKRTGDRLGLVLFGTRAFLQTPLTFDRQTLATQLDEAQLGFAGDNTSIGDAIALSAKRLQDRNQKSRVLILLTDGANTAGELTPLQGADVAADIGVKIYTVGIGADRMEVRSFFGSRTVNPSADLDEKTLTAIADKTGGRYFRARNTEELQQIYSELDKLEPVEGDSETVRPITEYFYWPLAGALLLSGLLALSAAFSGRLIVRRSAS